ncbi:MULTISPECIES: hypothetical protein [unclassified Novosphingobium]|uniref:hypothetical protein n=1 Tax=unclassified Novosphingobium TaxID=2644732 RepID=UPI000D30536B|nr:MULTISPECIES: hypothetical protein [unclassified Novosphingobium]PTR06439.1 hypothetical protein C8K11_12052 [Novosphingobium sp. GV055]PUA94858.1 hypothetical protein C8K12_12052 [Novosphingobium sp. GV061]PUB13783.1 hypothetical protein C8K14_12052 [Novosphingobium sp. GV079]PUB38481.1 hypothetical protein C8K10_12052 [Novosphingobium sp. GV027]
MTNGTTVTKDRTAAVKAALKALVKDRVLVGIPSEKAFRDPEPDEPRPALNNAEIGYLNEFGAPEANIPARPHLVPGTQKALPKVEKFYREAAPKVLDGNSEAIRAAHGKVGFTVTSSIKNLITDGIAPPLAERTLENRKRRGREGETPLLDTGQYRRNIDFVIRPAGAKKGNR